MTINPWHDVETGKNSPNIVNAIIEIPKGSATKYELDKKTGMLKLDRFLHSAVYYPGDYGFIPKTLWEDNDPLDIMIITNDPVFPLTMAEVRVIGVMSMIDAEERDDKILAVYNHEPRFEEIKDVSDLPKHTLKELKHFFETYKELQGKKCSVEEFLGKEKAYKDIEKAQKIYKEKFPDK